MEIMIVWLLLGIVTAVAASNKGRDGCGWFILGCLLGPFALILALVVKDETPRTAIQVPVNTQEEPERICPFCAEDIKLAAVVCKHCGRDLPS